MAVIWLGYLRSSALNAWRNWSRCSNPYGALTYALSFRILCSANIFCLPLPTPSQNILGFCVEGKMPVFSIEALKWLRSTISLRALVNLGMLSKETFPKKVRVIWIFLGSNHRICPEWCTMEDWILTSRGYISRLTGMPINKRFSNLSLKSKAGNIQGRSHCHLSMNIPFYPENIFFHLGFTRSYNGDIHQP